MSQKYEKLKSLLKKMFQLDHPDLDFGIYRIMHARADEITKFLDRELLPQVRHEFSHYKTADRQEIQKQLDQATQQAQALGANPETLPKVIELKNRLATDSVDLDGLEAEVFDHLVQFFSRYYDEGDFISKRRYSRDGRYAIPYDGEEVKLYWANHDQYYIKTSEYLRDYSFRLKPDSSTNPGRVHFRLTDAAEGEHGNIKTQAGKERCFILTEVSPLQLEGGELFINFQYRPATLLDWPAEQRVGKSTPPKQKELTEIAERRIRAISGPTIQPWLDDLAKPHTTTDGTQADYSRLVAHLQRYVARNTFDYFIHKDLGGFLRRELDFYIKNEVMQLDDIENESVPKVEQYLSKIKVMRRVAGKLITFLAQLEDFQKALWLKKKFVVETQWCVALKEVPAEFYAEIAANVAQRAEWLQLYGIAPAKAKSAGGLFTEDTGLIALADDLNVPGSLMIDTSHFSSDFTAHLLEKLDGLDEKTDGVLFHSENFQALNLMQQRYREKVKCIYIDPPYNTDAGPIIYKNGYRSSSWVSLINDRLQCSRKYLCEEGVFVATIDDYQYKELNYLMEMEFGKSQIAGTVVIRSNPSGRPVPDGFAQSHEYAIFAINTCKATIEKLPRNEKQSSRYRHEDNEGNYMWELFRKRGSNSERSARPSLFYPIYVNGESIRIPKMQYNDSNRTWKVQEEPTESEFVVYPIDDSGTERTWRGTPEGVRLEPTNYKATTEKGKTTIYYKFRPGSDGVLPLTNWIDAKYSATEHGTGIIKQLFTEYNIFSYPKSLYAVEDSLRISGLSANNGIVLDYFAGSGTTGHATINLNREDGGNRRFILVEMGDHFNYVTLIRVKKVAFSPDWKDGKPNRLPTLEEIERGPRVFKIVRLESFEDTLNNIEVKRTSAQQNLLENPAAHGPDNLREQYLLGYLLKVEAQGSPSLLNTTAFTDPTAYSLVVKRPGSDESRQTNVDLIETFNWLIGLTVQHTAAPQVLSAQFERDIEKRLRLKTRLKADPAGPYWFRTVTGLMPDGRKALVIWRKLTGSPEEENLVLDDWFTRQGYSSRDSEFDLIFVNGGNNLENLKTPDDTWKVRLIEEDFQRLMFAGEAL